MTNAEPGATYRYVSDGSLEAVMNREGLRRLRRPAPLVALTVVGAVFGIGVSLVTNADSLPLYLGFVLLIGVAWGVGLVLLVLLVVAILVIPVATAGNRRYATRRFPAGSVTEVELGDDALVINRPTGTREIPYGRIHRVRPRGSFWSVEVRGRFVGEMLPLALLPEDAVEFIRTRARGAWPADAMPVAGTPTRQRTVPSGWAAHVAGVYTGYLLRRRDYWIRVGLASVVAALLAVTFGWAWLLVAPAVALLVGAATYEQVRRSSLSVLPVGSRATTHFFDDRFISRNAGGTREIRFDDVRSIDVRDDVVMVGFASQRGRLLIARDLIPENALEDLHRRVVTARDRAGG